VVSLEVNGRRFELDAPPAARLLDLLRERLGLVGTRFGCGRGDCGACHVLVDGRSVPACDTPLEACTGRTVTTVEGLAPRLRAAFVAEQAAQCGYCTSGMLVAAAALLHTNPDPGEAEVKAALDRHLCRCGAHPRIVRAVLRVAAMPA
jgi:nicotinate dehydrogenase subunit A